MSFNSEARVAPLTDAERHIYLAAVHEVNMAYPGCDLPWRVLAAIGAVVSAHGRDGRYGPLLDGRHGLLVTDSDNGVLDGSRSYDRAVGPLRLLPLTWRSLGARGSIHDLSDSAVAAARYLCSSTSGLRDAIHLKRVLTAYEPDLGFAKVVLETARRYGFRS